MTRKVPMRKCVVTQEQHPKKDLIRVVLTPDKTVEIDQTGRKNGRGAYLLLKDEVIRQAKKTGALNRSLKVKVEEEIYDELLELASKK